MVLSFMSIEYTSAKEKNRPGESLITVTVAGIRKCGVSENMPACRPGMLKKSPY